MDETGQRRDMAAAVSKAEVWPWWPGLGLLVWFAGYLAGYVHPELIYQARGPIFAVSPEYAQQVLAGPGGWLRYGALLLAQGDALDWLGTLLRLGQASLILTLAADLAARLAGRRLPWLALLPVGAYALACGQYDQPLTVGLLLIAVLAAGDVYLRLGARVARLAIGALLPLALARLAAGGDGPVVLGLALLGAALPGVLVELRRRDWLAAAVAGSAPALVAALDGAALASTRWAAVSPVVIPAERAPVLAFLALATAPLLALGAAALCRWPVAVRLPRATAPLLPLLVMTVLAATVGADRLGRYAARLESLTAREQWPAVLALTARDGVRGSLPCHDADRALFAAGRLADDLFTIEQRPAALILPLKGTPSLAFRQRLARQYLALGRLRDAEHLLNDCLPLAGPNPWVLRDLATCAAAQDEPEAARLYLNCLARDLVHGRWAARMLRGMEADPRVAALRAARLTTDDVAQVTSLGARDSGTGTDVLYSSEAMLLGVLRDHPDQRMAYEYLMGLYLLSGRLDRLAAELGRMDRFGYPRLPRAWEEGLAVWEAHGGAPLDLHGRAVSAATRQRYERCREIADECGDDREAASARVHQACPDSYFAYRLRQGDRL